MKRRTVTSTVYCEHETCPGHVTTRTYPAGSSLVLTDDADATLAVETDGRANQ